MHAARARSPLQWALTHFCSAAAVRSALTNYTLDDTSPAIVYTQPPLIRCAPGVSCDPDWVAGLYNGTSSVTGFYWCALYWQRRLRLPRHDRHLRLQPRRPHDRHLHRHDQQRRQHNAPRVPQREHARCAARACYISCEGRVVRPARSGGVYFLVRRREQRRRVSVRGVLLYDYWPDKPKPSLDVKLSELAPAHAK
ncbi:hypothetical protein B0H13DRAFT_2012346 [Mycena leptocephala]|nr:hypothetical protein B0H13DRAFT_2012346 [Mycena leptocephala]